MKYYLVKIFWFFVNPLKNVYFFIFRSDTNGVKCLVEKDGKFLFVKLNYAHRSWTTPGGGVHKGESFLHAAIRECKEETGIDVLSPVFIGRYENQKKYKKDIVEVYYGNSDKIEAKVDGIEIEKVEWMARDQIPKDHSFSVERVFELYDRYRSKTN